MDSGSCHIQAFPKKMGRKNRAYYDRVSFISRRSIDDEMEEIVIQFEAGGKLHILTSRPLLWVDPEVH